MADQFGHDFVKEVDRCQKCGVLPDSLAARGTCRNERHPAAPASWQPTFYASDKSDMPGFDFGGASER